MQVLIFHIGAARFGLPTAAVTRVLPMLACTAIPGAPPCVAGLVELHGRAVPVVDLGAIHGAASAAERQNTRLLLVEYPGADGLPHPLGLLAEGVAGTARLDPTAVLDSGVRLEAAPQLGQVVATDQGLLQLIALQALLPPAVRALLFSAPAP
ncbi:MAG: chemotaxis protein CheW [Pseudomonadota bacterium]